MKNLIELFFNTENIPHNSTILHEIRCFFGSFDHLQNQSLKAFGFAIPLTVLVHCLQARSLQSTGLLAIHKPNRT